MGIKWMIILIVQEIACPAKWMHVKNESFDDAGSTGHIQPTINEDGRKFGWEKAVDPLHENLLSTVCHSKMLDTEAGSKWTSWQAGIDLIVSILACSHVEGIT